MPSVPSAILGVSGGTDVGTALCCKNPAVPHQLGRSREKRRVQVLRLDESCFGGMPLQVHLKTKTKYPVWPMCHNLLTSVLVQYFAIRMLHLTQQRKCCINCTIFAHDKQSLSLINQTL